MYNRYIRNEQGGYTRIREEEPSQAGSAAYSDFRGQNSQEPHQAPNEGEAHRWEEAGNQEASSEGGRRGDGLSGFLRHLLDQFHLESVDTGDLLLLGLLFLLYREKADEELLIALGLLLIL